MWMMSRDVEIEAEVKGFLPNAMRDEYDSGNCVSYDATELEIAAPKGLAGTTIKIFHTKSPSVESPWREEGHRLRFTMGRKDIKSGGIIFEGALRNLSL